MQSIRWLVACVAVVSCSIMHAQGPAAEASVVLDQRPVFTLRAGVGSFTPAERAAAVNQRLREVSSRARTAPRVTIQRSDLGLLLQIGETPIVSITEADARLDTTTVDALAQRWSAAITGALAQVETENAARTFFRRLLVTAAVAFVTLALLWLLPRGRRAARRRFASVSPRLRDLTFRGLELVKAGSVIQIVDRAIALTFWALGLVIVAAALLLVFNQFPATQGYARTVFRWVWQPLVDIFRGTVSYLPNLFYIAVIIAVTRAIIRAIRFIFDQTDRGAISLEPWIHRDVARPTGQILKTIVAVIALFFIAPLIPGTGSTAAQGLSVIIGLAVSFGSSSTVGNLIGGVILTYMRPFTLGDRVRIADTTGDVVERTFLHTKVLTIKNEEVVIPSLMVLGSAMTNYSARAKASGLIVHTSVTIGYDAPWRQVHQLLIDAATATAHVSNEPPPFVLQTALDDWFVSYQINVYTRRADLMAGILSELHQHIQDKFNEAGVEIMSPHYLQLRDGNARAMPAEYTAKEAPRRFLVDARTAAD